MKIFMLLSLIFALTLIVGTNGKPMEADNAPILTPLSTEIINYVNNKANTTWTAGHTVRFKTISELKRTLGFRRGSIKTSLLRLKKSLAEVNLPESFDARMKWPKCTTIGEIRDQSDCGSCWAFGAVEAMSDRICIHSNGSKKVELSAEDLITCCIDCGDGCDGGDSIGPWLHWVKHGIVTGGGYQSNYGCIDYPLRKCSHYIQSRYPNCNEWVPTPPCAKKCKASYAKTYEEDKHYGKSAYRILDNPRIIMGEIYLNGPVEACFKVYGDFVHYREGVYEHVAGGLLGGHCVKILGWGVENGTPFWWLANSWNELWGDKGFFKILRGANECGIERDIVAGMPR